MCEQTEVDYLDGDVVWVKLGPCWWPGEVRDVSKLPSEIVKAFKKPPIAVVKFFQEDQYEYVKNINHIYKYNCRKKNEFIKKGLDMHRAKNTFMDKFPADVCHAETLTGGDPDIITSDEFAPEQKTNYAAIFGSPSPKKSTKTGRGRSSLGTPKTSRSSLSPQKRITHPRFVGKSDHEVRMLEQTTPTATASHYTCHICGFESSRLNVIVLHNRSHSNGTYVSSSKQKSKKSISNKKGKRPKSFATTNSIDEDLELIRQGATVIVDSSDQESEREEGSKNKKAKVSNICNNLLADWGDSDSNENEADSPDKPTKEAKNDTEPAKKSVHNELLADWEDKNSDEESGNNSTNDAVAEKKSESTGEKVSCFDFEEEEENAVLEKSPGRKIPRVIPSKRVSKDTDDSMEVTEPAEKKENDSDTRTSKPVDTKAEEEIIVKDSSKKDVVEPDLTAFKSLLDETEAPDIAKIAEIDENKKSYDKKLDDCSSNEKTNGVLKKTDKNVPTTSETKEIEVENKVSEIPVAIPKKRIVRNFEEFESLLNEQKQDDEDPAPAKEPVKNKTTLEVSKLKSQLMSKLTDTPVKSPAATETDSTGADKKSSASEDLGPIEILTEKPTEKIIEKITEKPAEKPVKKKIAHSETEDSESEDISVIADQKNSKPSDIIEERSVEGDESLPEPEHIKEKEFMKPTESDPEASLDKIDEVPIEEMTETTTETTVDTEMETTIDSPIVSTEESKSYDEKIEEESVLDKQPVEEQKVEDVAESSSANVEETVVEMKEAVDETKETIVEEVEQKVDEQTVQAETVEYPLEEPVAEPEVPQEVIAQDVPMEEETPETQVADELSNTQEYHEELPPIAEDSRSQKMLADICIDNADNLSGLSTLAAVSELTGNLYDKTEAVPPISSVVETKDEHVSEDTSPLPSNATEDTESRDVSSVEQVPDVTDNQKSIATLANFSMDFSDSNSESMIIKNVTTEEVMSEKFPVETVLEHSEVELSEANTKPKEISIAAADVPTDFESIESEIEKITSMETNSDKLNSFPENISQVTQDCVGIDATGINYTDFTMAETSTTVTTSVSSEFVAKVEEPAVHTEATLESEIAKLTDTHPGTESVLEEQQQNTSSSKLLEILTESKNTSATKKVERMEMESPGHVARTVISPGSSQKVHMVITGDSKSISKKFDPKTSKFVIKSATTKSPASTKSNKPIILSEKIIKPVTETENVSVKKVTSKRTYQDVEDIDTFIIQKPNKKPNIGDNDQQDIILTPKTDAMKYKSGVRARGKPKIIEQTIIKAADIVQQVPLSSAESQPLLDDSMFDINSMPIVLSDQILTPESIENMPVVMADMMATSSVTPVTTVQTIIAEKPQQTIAVKRGGAIQQVKLLNKSKISTSQPESSPKLNQSQNVVVKNIMPRGLAKNQKVYQTGSKLLKNNPAVITQPGKPGKFIILPSTTTSTTGGSKYTVGKRLTTVKSMPSVTSPTTSKLKAMQNVASEPTGNKIMIVTNQQGVQSRVLLTPAQQKLLGCKMPTTKIAKSGSQQLKSGVMQKSILTSKGTIMAPVNSSGMKSQSLTTQTIVTSKGQIFTTPTGQTLVTSEGQVLTPITQQQLKTLKSEQHKIGKKITGQQSRVLLPDKSNDSPQKKMIMSSKTKTILIKGSQGQALKKIQSTMGESKNILLSQGGQKTSQLVSLGGQQISSGMTGKQVMITSKGQIVKSDGKIGLPKQTVDKLQRVQSPKVLSTTSRTVAKSPGRTQMMLSPVSGMSVNKQQLTGNVAVPPLAPITAGQNKKDLISQAQALKQQEQKIAASLAEKEKLADAASSAIDKTEPKQPNQLIIQDTLGNQTTVTEGQILALPSGETVDGQPQSYMLVTVDETGNLVPISNDTLMSLDPSLALGGDMNNIVLQIDPGAQENAAAETKPAETLPAPEVPVEEQQFTSQTTVVESTEQQQQLLAMDNQQLMLPEQNILTTTASAETQHVVPEQQQVFMDKEQENFIVNPEETQVITSDPSALMQESQQTAVACSIGSGESSQQLIITGDPESTQKFLASLSDGNTDLSSLLSGTDGNIIINTDGQQILLNTDSDNQILLSVNSDNLGLIQATTESDVATQNAMYVTQQAMKNQDILAAALADTDVFQQEASADKLSTSQTITKVIPSSAQSQLSPNSSLYPMNVGNVLETSLTLGSPIMTPLEVPSVNTKKITTDVESTLISQVPSSLELPITITDPSISQTVSQQVMLTNDLQSNLDLPITMIDNTSTSIRSSEINSPSFVYSLPTLDENSDLEQKRVFTESSAVITTDSMYNTALTGSMSMPLLTEEPEIAPVEQEQTSTSTEEPPVTSASETVAAEAVVTESEPNTNYDTISSENIQTTMAEKISNELQIGPIEEELDLNPSDICSSLSEPPPGMFDKSSFSNFLGNKEEDATIPLPTDTDCPADTATATDDSSVLNEPVTSLPILSDSTEPEPEIGTSDMLTTSSGTTEKSAEESNLDMDYGASESSDQHSISETAINQDVPRSNLSETPNSDLNSPRLDIDENSTEIPLQPQIITNLSETFDEKNTSNEFNTNEESKKRSVTDEEEDDSDAKRAKISCD